MNVLGYSLRFLLLIINSIIGIGLLFCAYSSYISPFDYPVLACAGLGIPFFLVANLLFLFVWLVVKPKFLLVPLIFFMLGWNAVWNYCPLNFRSKTEGGETIKLLTYNTMGMSSAQNREENPILDYLKASDADIICLQEYPVTDKRLSKKLGYPYKKMIKLNSNNGLACFSRYPILSARRIDYPSGNNGSMLLRLKLGEDTLSLICNHLESNKLNQKDKEKYKKLIKSPDEQKVKTDGTYLLRKLADAVTIRSAQADSVAKAISLEQSRYLIVCGDFNDSPASYTYRTIAENLQDAYAEAGVGPGYSYNRNLLFFRIDHILTNRSFRVIDCRVDRSIKTSDHYPVWALLEKL